MFALVGQLTEALILLVAPGAAARAWMRTCTVARSASTEGLSEPLASSATCRARRLEASRCVDRARPGDLVDRVAGRAFPADGLLVAGERMQVDESALTGEAFPVPQAAARAACRRRIGAERQSTASTGASPARGC